VAAFVFFFLAADYAGVRTPLGAPLLRRQGKYAFGLYLLHAIVATVFLRAFADAYLDLERLGDAAKLGLLTAALALSYGLAVVVYWGFEMPVFRYFRDRRWRAA
jgi:peptidoglycan/LPS O-acetylase OafA/YrhL